MITLSYDEIKNTFTLILQKTGLSYKKAMICAKILADNTKDGVPSHGVNRFVQFVERITNGGINSDAEPNCCFSKGGFEQWDGNNGIGPYNALLSMNRAIELARINGVGAVALRNTTHWMRGATYGHHAAEQGIPAMCWTNTGANMMPWGSTVETIGNNPIVYAMPGTKYTVVLDMALSQFSYGKIQSIESLGKPLDFYGGFDSEGELTKDPSELLKTHRVLPIGLWKGSGLSIMVDLFTSILSSGDSTVFIDKIHPYVCQLFIAFDISLSVEDRKAYLLETDRIIDQLKNNGTNNKETILYPGEGTIRRRNQSESGGIEVNEDIWESILDLV